ncbi:hypothetical protein [uncultured Draconibacterium sp.]|uniref:hypothetical protein n=1 Tax=uncultured Draconibacterium sp. TaxID=1573823 RepID=UPI0032618BF0
MNTLKINGKEHPFEVTARGRLNLEESKVNLNKVALMDNEALRFAFQVCKGACKHVETEFKFDFNAFVDKVEVDVFDKARALALTLLPAVKEKTKPETVKK